MSEGIPGKSETELSTEAFVESMTGIHPDLDRERFHDEISKCVQDALSAAGSGEESEDESDEDESDENESDKDESSDDEK
ncbi:MAG: hypothetical protein M3518_09340 [Actinomycetota bacterium]|nr:hypothetical protein [Actinomycetota bacterium]